MYKNLRKYIETDQVGQYTGGRNPHFESPSMTEIFLNTPVRFNLISEDDHFLQKFLLKPKEGIFKLRRLIEEKFASISPEGVYLLSYKDVDGKQISLTTNEDLIQCVRVTNQLKQKSATVKIHFQFGLGRTWLYLLSAFLVLILCAMFVGMVSNKEKLAVGKPKEAPPG
ncbi:hypothetical protein CAAN3_20S00342 [[Candida] anglica]